MKVGKPKISLAFSSAVAFLALVLTGCPVWQRQDTPVNEFKVVEPTTKAKYYLYVPSEYDQARAWPMVVTLHGTPGYDSARAQVKEWKALAEKHGFIVLSPSLTSVQGVLPVSKSARRKQLAVDEQRVLAMMKEVKGQYNIDERAVMITGFSAGGYPMYYIALRNPEKFNVLVARMCNCDLETLRSIPVTDAVRNMHMLIYFSKTGINPIYSKHNPIGRQSWEAYRHLRLQKHRAVKIKSVEGGHQRQPERAYTFWRRYWPASP